MMSLGEGVEYPKVPLGPGFGLRWGGGKGEGSIRRQAKPKGSAGISIYMGCSAGSPGRTQRFGGSCRCKKNVSRNILNGIAFLLSFSIAIKIASRRH